MKISTALRESVHRKALDLAADGEWGRAHKVVQVHDDDMSCLIHGYLHRVEGDNGNAAYWYRRARETMPDNTLAAELARLYGLLDASRDTDTRRSGD